VGTAWQQEFVNKASTAASCGGIGTNEIQRSLIAQRGLGLPR